MMHTTAKITISVVSHGHRNFVIALIKQLAASPENQLIRLIVTINAPALDHFDETDLTVNSSTEIVFLKNDKPKGFGSNHNQAFQHCTTQFFCIINPDIELILEPFTQLINTLTASNVGLVYPLQINEQHIALDFERMLVSPTSIAQRHLLRQRDTVKDNKLVHWVSGSFLMFKSSVFKELNGFDDRYFMYCEDVDICLRMQLAGYKLACADVTVIHHTQRQTLKNLQHLAWHIRSLLRLWNSAPYKKYKLKFIDSHD
jgi:N-acetylglucosaminyl-diphospho-decaprenol L-rhamnosyltransferase